MIIVFGVFFFLVGLLARDFTLRGKANKSVSLLDIRKGILRDFKLFLEEFSFKDTSKECEERHAPQVQVLLTRDDVQHIFMPETWQRRIFEEFSSILLAQGPETKTFPCVYATLGLRRGEHRYVFLDSEDPSEPRNIRKIGSALHEYLLMSHSLGSNTSLVIFGREPQRVCTMDTFISQFWSTLRGLRIYDHKPWPCSVPTHTAHSKWTFCFDSTPLFPVALTPAHMDRQSRYMPCFTIAMQPKWVLDKLLCSREKRESVTKNIRSLLEKYDQVDVSPDLTAYGDPDSSETHQLFLRDENRRVYCPFGDMDVS